MDANPALSVDNEDVSISLFDMMDSLSTALDLINPALSAHHKLTCYVAACVAEEMGFDDESFNALFSAAIMHDIGAIALADRMRLLEFEVSSPHLHGELGAVLLSKFPPFGKFAPLVKFHHVPWRDGEGATFRGEAVPSGNHMIHLADRVAVLINPKVPIFEQVSDVREKIAMLSGATFVPEMVEAFLETSRREVFWLDFVHRNITKVLKRKSRLPNVSLDLDGLLAMSRFYALIIDTRSRFTATHSSGVAASAEKLARLYGLGDFQAKKVRVAGYLHDIGKLAVPDSILEKQGKLDLTEWRTVRSHTYYTYEILDAVEGLHDIATWAADHHEHVNGDGYPFRHQGHELPLESRLLAVADVFTALAEDRPYRAGLGADEVQKILRGMAKERKLDAGVVSTICENYADIEAERRAAQTAESIELADFWEGARNGIGREGKWAS
jgi:putative nucleotidyltransferase with HDIG domain